MIRKLLSQLTATRTIVIITLAMMIWAFSRPGLPAGHDTYAHATYAKIFFESLSQGQFPVRWVEHSWIGFGQPLFNYYQVGFFYLVSLFLPILPLVLSIKLTVVLLWGIGGLGIYLLAKPYGTYPALTATIAYLFSPYILLDLFIRTSLPEFTSLSLIPLLCWSITRLITHQNRLYFTSSALLTGLAICAHPPTVLLFSPIIAIFTLLKLGHQIKSPKIMLQLASSALLGLALSAFYILPATTQQHLIQIQILQTGMFNFNQNFVQPDHIFSYIWGYNGDWWGSESSFSFLIGITPWIIISGTVITLAIRTIKRQSILPDLIFWLFCICYALFFANSISSFIWNNLSIFNYFQFPWRFFMLIPISTAMLVAMLIQNTKPQIQNYTLISLFTLTLAVTIPFIYTVPFTRIDAFNLPFRQWQQNPEARYLDFWEPAYSPANTINTPTKEQFSSILTPGDQLQINSSEIQNHQITIDLSAQSATHLTINKPYFPNWQAYINGNPTLITATEPYNFMLVSIPAGESLVQIKLEPSIISQTGNYVSLIALSAFLLIYSSTFSTHHKPKRRSNYLIS